MRKQVRGVIVKFNLSTDLAFITCCRQVTAVFNNFNGELEAAGASLHGQALQQTALDASEFFQTSEPGQPSRSSGSPKIAVAPPGPVRKRKAQSYGAQLQKCAPQVTTVSVGDLLVHLVPSAI